MIWLDMTPSVNKIICIWELGGQQYCSQVYQRSIHYGSTPSNCPGFVEDHVQKGCHASSYLKVRAACPKFLIFFVCSFFMFFYLFLASLLLSLSLSLCLVMFFFILEMSNLLQPHIWYQLNTPQKRAIDTGLVNYQRNMDPLFCCTVALFRVPASIIFEVISNKDETMIHLRNSKKTLNPND